MCRVLHSRLFCAHGLRGGGHLARPRPHERRVFRTYYATVARHSLPADHRRLGWANHEVHMNDRQTRVLESYQRILGGRDRNATSLAPEVPVIVERLASTVADIVAYRSKQYLARTQRAVASARSKLEKMRKNQMLPLATLARRVFAGEAGIEAALRVPHKRAPTNAILAAAAFMVKTLRPHRAVLATAGIEAARIERLRLETQALKKVFESAYASFADRAMPTRRLPEPFASARMDVQALDALIGAGGSVLDVLTWKHERRVGKRIGRPPTRRIRAGDKPVT